MKTRVRQRLRPSKLTKLMNKIGWIFVGVVLCIPQTSLAIVNVLPTGQSKVGFHGNVKASLARRTGNTNILQLSGGVDLAQVGERSATTLSAKFDYGEKPDQDEPVYLSKAFEHLRYRYGYNDWLTLEALLQHQYDAFKRLKFRGLTGAGVAVRGQPLENLNVTWGVTYLLEYEVEEGKPIELYLDSMMGLRRICKISVKLVTLVGDVCAPCLVNAGKSCPSYCYAVSGCLRPTGTLALELVLAISLGRGL